MICSEFVAWVYEDEGLQPQAAKWWLALNSAGLLGSMNRKKDYTTPNMLAMSPSFKKAGRLKGFNF